MRTKAVVLGLAAGSAQSAPYTLYFDYTITSYSDYTSGTVPGNVGGTYSGWLTFDPDNGTGVNYVAGNVQYQRQEAESGCGVVQNGVCSVDLSTAPAVVTPYSIATPLGSFGRWTDGALAPRDYSSRENVDGLVDKPNANYWRTVSGQSQEETAGSLASPGLDYVVQTRQRYLELAPFTTPFDAAAPFTDYDQLAEAPLVLPPGQRNVLFNTFERSTRYGDAGYTFLGYRPGSFEMSGTLTSARLEAGPAQVPLPGTLAMLGLGALGLIGATRFTRRA